MILEEALDYNFEEDDIKRFVACLNTLRTDRLQSAILEEINGEVVLYFVAEDGTNYAMYLSKSNSVEAVQNLDTKEWPITSYK